MVGSGSREERTLVVSIDGNGCAYAPQPRLSPQDLQKHPKGLRNYQAPVETSSMCLHP